VEVPVSEVRDLAEALRAGLLAADPSTYSGEDAADVAEELGRTEKACAAARVKFAARAAACGEHRRRGHAAAPDWMAATSGSSRAQARSELTALEQVEGRPETRDALSAGDISIRQAAAIAAAPADCESELLELARGSGLGTVQDRAREHRLEAMDVDALHARQHQAREVSHRIDDDLGMIRIDALLSPEIGVPLVNRLDVETDRTWRAAQRRGEDITRAQAAADAFARMTRADGTRKPRSPELILLGDLAAFQRGHTHPGEVSHILGGGPVPVSVLHAHARDAFIKIVLHDGVKIETVLHWGRYRRAELETALSIGTPPRFDGVTCDEPGCDRRYGLQWDHVDPVANGGVTSLDNLRPRCRPHHVEKTERDRRAGKLGNRKERAP
jgi:hypothetical protein